MPPDKYSAIWVSHTSISDFLRCPRVYFLKNVYRDPKNNHKIKIMSPALALGQAVHEVVESLSLLPKERRFDESLLAKFDRVWEKVKSKKGGFADNDIEYSFKERGQAMLRRIINHPGPLTGLSIKIQMDLPYFWLSEEDNIILCGKIDWLEYLPETDSVHIIDFKTGKSNEDVESLQLPIYHLLVHHCQKRPVSKASYWYLDHSDILTEKKLPDLETARQSVLETARQIKLARQLERFKCPHGDGCPACRPFEAILKGEAEFIGEDSFHYDIYVVDSDSKENREGAIL